MARIYFLISMLLFLCRTNAQQIRELRASSEEVNNTLSITGFSYPLFISGEMHSNFAVNYPLGEKFEAELQGFYDTYMLADVTRFALRGKYYAGEKFYFFAGMAIDIEQNKVRGDALPKRLFLLNGVGYDFNDKINLELNHETQMNKSGSGLYGIPNLFSVHGKYKF